MASSRALALALFLLCALLPPPPVSATLLFGGGESAKKAGVDAEWRPATATWYGEAEGDGSDGERSQLCSSTHYHAGLTGLRDSGLGVVCIRAEYLRECCTTTLPFLIRSLSLLLVGFFSCYSIYYYRNILLVDFLYRVWKKMFFFLW